MIRPLRRLRLCAESRVIAIGLALFSACQLGFGQIVPSLDELDRRISQASHQKVIESGSLIEDVGTQALLSRVVGRISRSSFFRGYQFPTQVFYTQDSAVNAFSTGYGRVYVTSGLVQAVHGNEGILAFAIAHEMAHNRLQHQARDAWRRMEYEIEYRRLRAQNPRLALAYDVTWHITDKKIRRDEEHAADKLGVQAAAEAGYHPDYGILAVRLLRASVPDSSKFLTFFYSDHPRWITREEHEEKSYSEATAIFDRNWPRVEASPGGVPPALAIVSPIKIQKTHSGITASAEVQVNHLGNVPALLSAQLIDPSGTARTVFTRQYAGEQLAANSVAFEIPKADLRGAKTSPLFLQIKEGDDLLYGSGPISLRSSHKAKADSRSAAASTTQAAETEVAKLRGNERTSEEGTTKDADDFRSDSVLASATASLLPKSSTESSNEETRGPKTADARQTGPPTFSWQQGTAAAVITAQEPPMCEVEINSNPRGAKVDVNGTQVGTTPTKIRFKPSGLGFTIYLTKEGYSPWWVQSVAISGRQQFEANLDAIPAPSKASSVTLIQQ